MAPRKKINVETSTSSAPTLSPQAIKPLGTDPIFTPRHSPVEKRNPPTLLLLALLFLAAYFFYDSYMARRDLTKLKDVAKEAQTTSIETKDILAKLEKHIVLPQDESPMIATINDPEALAKEQTFYVGAQKGDKVIVYFKARKAIVYSPAKDIILNVGPVYLQEQSGAFQTQPIAPEAKVKLEIRNGSPTAGAAKVFAEQFKDSQKYEVSKTGNAANQDYAQAVIVNAQGKDVSELETLLNVQSVKDLPSGEAAPEGDVLVILGK